MITALLAWLAERRHQMEQTSMVKPVSSRIVQLGREVAYFAAMDFLMQHRMDYLKDPEKLVDLLLKYQKASIYMGGDEFQTGFDGAMREIRSWSYSPAKEEQ